MKKTDWSSAIDLFICSQSSIFFLCTVQWPRDKQSLLTKKMSFDGWYSYRHERKLCLKFLIYTKYEQQESVSSCLCSISSTKSIFFLKSTMSLMKIPNK